MGPACVPSLSFALSPDPINPQQQQMLPVVVDHRRGGVWLLEGLLVPLNVNVGDTTLVSHAMRPVAERVGEEKAVVPSEDELG